VNVVILNGVFNRDDVSVVIFIQEVQHAGQAGSLSRTGWTGHQQQTPGAGNQPANGIRHADLLEGQKLAGDPPQNDADVSFLFEHGNAESAFVPIGKTKIRPPSFLKFLLTTVRSNGLHQGDGIVSLEYLGFELFHPALVPDYRWLADSDM